MLNRLPVLILAGLLCGATAARSGPGNGPEPPAPQAGTDTPPGYTVRNISAGTAQIKLAGASRIHLKGDGSLRSGKGGNTKVNGIHMEGCSRILVSDLQLSRWYCGVKCNNSDNVEFVRVTCTRNTQQGFLYTNGKQITMRFCEGSKTGGTRTSQHGCYFGCYQNGFTRDILVEDCSFFGSVLAEFQVNSETASKVAEGVMVRRTKVNNDKFAVNLLGVKGFQFEDGQIVSKKKAMSLDHPYGRSWPSTGRAVSNPVVGNVVEGTGSKLTKVP